MFMKNGSHSQQSKYSGGGGEGAKKGGQLKSLHRNYHWKELSLLYKYPMQQMTFFLVLYMQKLQEKKTCVHLHRNFSALLSW